MNMHRVVLVIILNVGIVWSLRARNVLKTTLARLGSMNSIKLLLCGCILLGMIGCSSDNAVINSNMSKKMPTVYAVDSLQIKVCLGE